MIGQSMANDWAMIAQCDKNELRNDCPINAQSMRNDSQSMPNDGQSMPNIAYWLANDCPLRKKKEIQGLKELLNI